MADDVASVQASLTEIKILLENKRKEKGDNVTTEVFTDPRFIEIFENYFKPLIDSSKLIAGNLAEKRNVSVFDIIGVSQKIQDKKRDALLKQLDKLTEKVTKLTKNLGNIRGYSLSEALGLNKTERTINKNIINNAVRMLSSNIHKTAKNVGDPKVFMRFLGITPIKLPKVAPPQNIPISIEEPVVFPEHRNRENTRRGLNTEPNVQLHQTLAEQEMKRREVVPVAIVEISDEIQDWVGRAMGKGGGVDDKGLHTGTDRESYSHTLNNLLRNIVFGLGLLGGTVTAIWDGLTSSGPLKGVEKMVGRAGMFGLDVIKSGIKHTINLLGKTFFNTIGSVFKSGKLLGDLHLGGTVTEIAGRFFKRGLMKIAGRTVVTFLGKVLKKVPGFGALIGLGFAIDRFSKGDIQGGLIDLASGIASTIPGLGTAASIALDIMNAQADLASGGVKSGTEKGGWLGKFNSYLGKKFSQLIFSSLNRLPFGMGKMVAGWMGLDMTGLALAASDDEGDNPIDTQFNSTINNAKDKLKTVDNTSKKAEKRKKEILNSRALSQLNSSELAEYKKQDEIIENANTLKNEIRTKIRGTEMERDAAHKKAEKTSTQTSTASEENVDENNALQDANNEQSGSMRADTPYQPLQSQSRKTDNEGLINEIKVTNDILSKMNDKAVPTQQMDNTPNVNIATNTTNNNSNNSGRLQYAIEAVRDTCYNSREKSRGMILDYRGIA